MTFFCHCRIEHACSKLSPWLPVKARCLVVTLKQIKDCNPTLKDLIKRCWNGRPNERPTFAEIVLELKLMLGEGQQSRPASPERSRPASPELSGAE